MQTFKQNGTGNEKTNKTELSTTEGRDLRIKIPAQAKLEKEGTLDPLEEGFEHVGDALLVWQCSILGGGG